MSKDDHRKTVHSGLLTLLIVWFVLMTDGPPTFGRFFVGVLVTLWVGPDVLSAMIALRKPIPPARQ